MSVEEWEEFKNKWIGRIFTVQDIHGQHCYVMLDAAVIDSCIYCEYLNVTTGETEITRAKGGAVLKDAS